MGAAPHLTTFAVLKYATISALALTGGRRAGPRLQNVRVRLGIGIATGCNQQARGGSAVRCIVGLVGSWGVASFENDAAGEWFLLVEEAPDPGAIMASAIDEVLGAAEYLEVDLCREAIAAAELCACCAGQPPDRLPDNVYGWVQANPHGPHADEIELAVQAVSRVRDESELRDLWEGAGDRSQWLAEVDDLLSRLGRSSAGSPPSVSP